jgi:hypothetical protein
MMNKTITWCMVGLLLFSGCVPTLNAIYTDKDLVFDPSVVGVWSQRNSSETWSFQQRDAKSYRLTYTDREGHTGNFVAHLAEVEGLRFLDLFPEQHENDSPGFYRIHYVPIHTVYLVKETGDKVVLAAMDGAWLEPYLTAHTAEVPSVSIGSSRMLTASTERLQRFLVDNKDRFLHEVELTRQADSAVN